jgi:hypothetical protein
MKHEQSASRANVVLGIGCMKSTNALKREHNIHLEKGERESQNSTNCTPSYSLIINPTVATSHIHCGKFDATLFGLGTHL